jgi:hypothetical protein
MKNERTILWCGALLSALAAVTAAAAPPMKDPLYGDPSHPNLSGMWNPEFAYLGPPIGPPPPRPAGAPGGGPPPGAFRPPPGPQLTPPYAKRFAEWKNKFDTDGSQEPDTVTRCLAFGMVRFGTMPMEIIQTPGQITMNLGVLHDIRRIYLDGIGHTVGADPSFSGDSVGHWEGDTLVVETNNLRAGTMDRNGMPYSDKLTAVEKYRRVGPARLEVETTLTDPEAFVAPFTMKRVFVPMPPGSRFEEYICENNKDL